MLFTPDSTIKARRALFQQMKVGILSREQAFQQALALDPFDVVSLIMLAEERHKAGDLAGTAQYCCRAVAVDPCHYEPWLKLCSCLAGGSGIASFHRSPAGFQKSQVLFNYRREWGAAGDLVIVVEGLFDCMPRVHQVVVALIVSAALKQTRFRQF
jgi:hypothetical protein